MGPTVGLGDADSARLFHGATLIDSHDWAAPAATTWSRCPDSAGAFIDDAIGTKGLPNACSAVTAWPGSSTVSEVDVANSFGGDLSGLAYEGSGSTSPGTLWGVQNGNGQLRKITKSGGTWGSSATYTLHYPTGIGKPDAEGVTVTTAGAAGGVYVATERDGDNNGVSRPAILRFVPTGPSGALTASNDWDLTGDLPGLGANFGLEAVAWVPDSYLTAKGFKLDAGAVYDPVAFPNHGNGLFFVGVEQTGEVIGYALNHSDDTFAEGVDGREVHVHGHRSRVRPGQAGALGGVRQQLRRAEHDADRRHRGRPEPGPLRAGLTVRAALRDGELQQRGVHDRRPLRVRGWLGAGLLGRRRQRQRPRTALGHHGLRRANDHRCRFLEQGQVGGRLVRRSRDRHLHLHARLRAARRCLPRRRWRWRPRAPSRR